MNVQHTPFFSVSFSYEACCLGKYSESSSESHLMTVVRVF